MIRAYLRRKKKRIFLDIVFVFIFALCFYLTDTSLYAIWYPFVLCVVFFLLFVSWDFYCFLKRHMYLLKLKQHIDETLEHLPVPENQLEEDYQDLVRTLFFTYKEYARKSTDKIKANQEYIALWTHQIKTPVTAMELMLQELGEESFDKKRMLLESLFEIEQYADILLQYIRLDTMASDLLLREYSLFDIVKQAVKYFARTFIAKKISLQLTEADVVVVTDEKWLLFVLKQLLSNALKYTKKGSVSIYMDFSKRQTLVIEDTGIGIAAEDLPRLYERGFTGYNGRIQKKSTGIGLYLSKMILDRLGHGISITSKEGEGARVELMLGR